MECHRKPSKPCDARRPTKAEMQAANPPSIKSAPCSEADRVDNSVVSLRRDRTTMEFQAMIRAPMMKYCVVTELFHL